MAWIRLYTNITRNPKTRRFARLLKISNAQAIGHLVTLWSNVLEVCDTGELTKYDNQAIADLADWQGDPAVFKYALLKSNWVDQRGTGRNRRQFIHDWYDHVDRYLITKYRKYPEKWEKVKAILLQNHTFIPGDGTTSLQREEDDDLDISQEEPRAITPDSQPSSPTPDIIPYAIIAEDSSVLDVARMITPTGQQLTPPGDAIGDKIMREKDKILPAPLQNKQDLKVKHLECVFLSFDELEKLRILYSENYLFQKDSCGDQRLQYGIQMLNDYIMARNKVKTYKSHYHVLRGWVLKQVRDDEKRAKVRFSPPINRQYRKDLTQCRDCEEWIPMSEWGNHECNPIAGSITGGTARETVERLRNALRSPVRDGVDSREEGSGTR